MDPILKMLLVYMVAMIVLIGAVSFCMKIDPQHDELAKEEYRKRLQDELRRLGS